MIKNLFIGLIVLLIALGVGFMVHKDSGYVLVSYGHWTVETSFWMALLIIALLFAIIYFLLRLLHYPKYLKTKYDRWVQMRRLQKLNQSLQKGLCYLAEGQQAKAELKFNKSISYDDKFSVPYVAAAYAANEQQAFDRRNQYLSDFKHKNQNLKFSSDLIQAQMAVKAQQWNEALSTLSALRQESSSSVAVLDLLYQVYLKLNDWDSLFQLLPALKKHHVLDKDKLLALEEQVYLHQLQKTHLWEQIPKNWKSNPHVVNLYVEYLITSHQDEEAISLIANTLKKHWDPHLLKQYSKATSHDLVNQLAIAEKWLEKHPKESELLFCCGKLCFRNQFLGKAKYYFEQYLQIKRDPRVYSELARVMAALGNKDAAIEYYQKSNP